MSPTPASGETPEGCDVHMRMLRLIVIVLALFEAGWITVDGVRAFTVGGYLTPRMGPYGGKLGPWTRVVWAVGLSPRSAVVKGILVGYGLCWLGAVLAFSRGAGWAWWAMVLAAAGAFWYSTLFILLNMVQLLLLLAARRDV